MNKKAEILHEHVIFIILNVVFFSIMLLFIYIQGSSVHLTEEETAKQIALIIDAVKPGTTIEINLKDLFAKAEKKGISKNKVVEINNDENLVIVRGSEKSFYEYSYFNDVDVEPNINEDYFILVIK